MKRVVSATLFFFRWVILLYAHPEGLVDELIRRPAHERLGVSAFVVVPNLLCGSALAYLAGLHFAEAVRLVLLGLGLGILSAIVLGLYITWRDNLQEGIAVACVGGTAACGILAVAIPLSQLASSSRPILAPIITAVAAGAYSSVAVGIVYRGGRAIWFGMLTGLALASLWPPIGETVLVKERLLVWCTYVLFYLRLYYLPLHLAFFWPQIHGQWYPFHPAAWDRISQTPFPRLYTLLLSFAEVSPEAGNEAILQASHSHPAHADIVKAIFIAREAALAKDFERLSDIVSHLPRGKTGLLLETPTLVHKVWVIDALQAKIRLIKEPLVREPNMEILCREIQELQKWINKFRDDPVALEFEMAASEWLRVAEWQRDRERSILVKHKFPQVFRAGAPIDRRKEAFVPRHMVLTELDRQIRHAGSRQPILLYGRRRTGKSTTLRNLAGFLTPNDFISLISMRDPRAFSSEKDFLEHVARAILYALHNTADPKQQPRGLQDFFRLLTLSNNALEKSEHNLILAVDEYENLDSKIGQGSFSDDLLTVLSESAHTHNRITWILSGSHAFTELRPEWSAHLVSALTIEIPLFSPDETRVLLTDPLRTAPSWSGNDSRPQFLAVWGRDEDDLGAERIHREAGGWPHLVQLIAGSLIDLVNESSSSAANSELMERALDFAVTRGDTALYQLMQGESTSEEWHYLMGFRRHPIQPPPQDETVGRSLARRLIVVVEGKDWRLRVPLMERWLRRQHT